MAQVSLAWLLHKEGVTAPIVGPTSVEKLQDLIGKSHPLTCMSNHDDLFDVVGSIDVALSAEEMRSLEEPYVPVPINGHQ